MNQQMHTPADIASITQEENDEAAAAFREAVKEYSDFAPFPSINPSDTTYTAYPVFVLHPGLDVHMFTVEVNGYRFRQMSPSYNPKTEKGEFPVLFRKL